eukprot:gene33130-40075_t
MVGALARAERTAGRLSVLFLDLDRFKQVNDTLGHKVGDGLLQEVARRMRECVRETDTVARIGGDEFVVLLDNIRGDLDAQVVAARLLEVLAEPYQIGPHRVSSSASIGVVTTAHVAEDPDSVLRDADIAMYAAKKLGRNSFQFYEPAMNEEAQERLLVLEREALEARERAEQAQQQRRDMEARWQATQGGQVSGAELAQLIADIQSKGRRAGASASRRLSVAGGHSEVYRAREERAQRLLRTLQGLAAPAPT